MARTLYDVAMERVKDYEEKSSLNPTKRGKVFQISVEYLLLVFCEQIRRGHEYS